MEFYVLLILAFLCIKHWYIDFVDQTVEEINSKGIYGQWPGMWHSVKHGIGTALVFFVLGVDLEWALLLGVVDFVMHYHVDWFKMNYGSKDIQSPRFWNHLGLDQLMHHLGYLVLVYLMLNI